MRHKAFIGNAIASLFALTSHASAGADVIFVDDDAPPNGDGTSWVTAFRFLQDGLTAAAAGGPGVAIHVGEGLYRPDRSAPFPGGTGDRAAVFTLVAQATLRGGYRGLAGGGDPNDRDVAAFSTILSGDLANDDEEPGGTTAENSRTVVAVPGIAAQLDGVTVRAGNCDDETCDVAGMRITTGSDLVVTACTFEENVAIEGAGALLASSAQVTVVETDFVDNVGSIGGAASLTLGGPHVFRRCAFLGNSGTIGAIWGLIANVELTNCVFFANSGGQGSAFFAQFGHWSVVNCTLANNQGASRGAAYSAQGTLSIRNSILWGNEPAQISNLGSRISVEHSLVEDGWPGAGNLASHPAFVNRGAGDLRIFRCSPAIDAGNNTVVPPDVTVDHDGAPRFVDDPETPDTGVGAPPLVDMGAFEFQGNSCPADLDGDGMVGFSDLLTVLNGWGPEPSPEDLDCSGEVGFGDIVVLLSMWGPC